MFTDTDKPTIANERAPRVDRTHPGCPAGYHSPFCECVVRQPAPAAVFVRQAREQLDRIYDEAGHVDRYPAWSRWAEEIQAALEAMVQQGAGR